MDANVMDGIVYIVQDPPFVRRPGKAAMTKDLSSAQRYGKLVKILEPGRQSSMEPGRCLMELVKALREFDPINDFLCFPGGDPMSLALAFVALEYNGIREFQYLRWERERDLNGERMTGAGFYVPVKVSLKI